METPIQLTEQNNASARVRIRFSLTQSHLSYRHLSGKTESESRAWVLMAVEHMAAILNTPSKEKDDHSTSEVPTAVPPVKRFRNNLPVQTNTPSEPQVKKNEQPLQLGEKLPGKDNYLSKVRSTKSWIT